MKMDKQAHQSGALTSPSPPNAERTSPVAFFETVYRAFQQAEEAVGGPIDRFYAIGAYTIRLRFAGSALIPFITPAFEHLAVQPVPAPALTVCLWDSVSTRTNMPPPPWSSDAYIARGEISGYNDECILTVFNLGPGMLNVFDATRDVALFWIQDATSVPYYETGTPLRTILHWFMRNHERQFVHAAAVGTSKGGVLLAGKGGSGKSTTTLACLSSDLMYVGDDYVLLGGQPAPYVYSLYNSAKLDADSIQRLPHLVPKVSNFDRLPIEKALIFLKDHYPDKLTTGFPIRAILVPRITGLPETRLTKSSPAAGLMALAPSTIFQLPGARNDDFQNLIGIVKQVPSFDLELGTDLTRIPEVILGLLSKDGQ
jgi:hypothetical protein